MKQSLITVWMTSLVLAACGSDVSSKGVPETGANAEPNGTANTGTVDSPCPEDLYESEGECVAPARIFSMSVGMLFEDDTFEGNSRVCVTDITDRDLYARLQKSPPGLVFSSGSCSVLEFAKSPPFEERGYDIESEVSGGFSVTKGSETIQMTAGEFGTCAVPAAVPDGFFDHDETYTLRSAGTEAPEFEHTIGVPGSPSFEAPNMQRGEDLVFEYRPHGADRLELFLVDPDFQFGISCVEADDGQLTVPASALEFLPAGEVGFSVFATNRSVDLIDDTMFVTVGFSTTRGSTLLVE